MPLSKPIIFDTHFYSLTEDKQTPMNQIGVGHRPLSALVSRSSSSCKENLTLMM